MAPTFLRGLVRAGRNHELTWRYTFNLTPTLAYKFHPPALSGEAARVLGDLNRDGIAITSAQTLLGVGSCYDELSGAVESLESDTANHLEAERVAANNGAGTEQKTFLVELLGARPVLDPSSVYARFALQKPILQIANAYFGMYTWLRYYNVWHTFATQSPARQSQLWHYDREDYFILKIFVYLSDVDDGAGPFTYAAGSHHKGKIRREPPYFLEGHIRRSTDQQMAEAVPPGNWIKGVGPKGTIIFADTRGYHKGGLARERDRIMYTCLFTSQTSQSQDFFERNGNMTLPRDNQQVFALTRSLRRT